MTPEQLGFDSRRLHRIADLTHRYVDEGKMPCVVVAVLRHGEEVYRDVYGQADMERGTPVADDTVFRFFSMTKPITSIGLLQLVEQGRVQLDDHVSDYIPEFADTEVYVSGDADGYETRPPDRPMEIVDLLRHTSGLSYSFLQSHPVDDIYANNGFPPLARETRNLEDAMKDLAGMPLAFSPGDHWGYSMSTDACGRIIEVVTGKQLSSYIEEHVTEPIGMTETAFWVRPHQHDRLAANYLATPDGGLLLIDDPETSPFREPPQFEGGGGGMVDAAANRMITSDGEFAWGGAASTAFWIDPAEGLAVVQMSQQVPSAQYPLRRELRNAVSQALT